MSHANVLNGAVERRTLSSQIYELLERKVLEGELPPGSRLSEELLAETYKVSRSPAREALADLERVGLAVRVGMRDRMITIPTLEMISQKFDVWWIIDVGRSYLASLTATPALHAELRQCVDRMSRAVKQRDIKRYQAACEKFHDRIRHGCNNNYVNQLSGDCDLYLRWFEMLYDKMPEVSEQTVVEHQSILDAYEKRDLSALSETIRVHIVRQRDRILTHFSRLRVSTASTDSDKRLKG